MIRFIFDSIGNSHRDIFLKIDVGISGNQCHISDFYYIPEFLNFESSNEDDIEWKKECFESFLNHLVGLINLGLETTYLVFDLQDQGTSAIKLERYTKNKFFFYKTSIVHSHKNSGWNMTYKMKQDEFIDYDWNNIDKHSWEITKDGLLKGLNWSIESLKCKIPRIIWDN